MKRVAIAEDTLKILKAGFYESPCGTQVNIEPQLVSCLNQTKCYDPDSINQIKRDILSTTPEFSHTEFEVTNETSLNGAERMAKFQQFRKIGVLNFASARNPGGGFLNGAQAQEESLARSSALYRSLLQCPEYYEFHRSHKSLLYSDRTIYSPSCPVFKTDDGTLLESPYLVDFITSSAPNAGQILRSHPQDVEKIPEVLRERGAKVLSLAAYNGCDALVLGAWGCGVFRNDPFMVAQMFADYLLPDGLFWGRFKSLLFSVLYSSKSQNILAEFEQRFSMV
jgi:uncharacterized protein (TIGR02452 family)